MRVGEQLTTILFDIGLKSKQMMLESLLSIPTGGRPGRGGSKETSLLYYLQIQPNPGRFKLRRMVDSHRSHAQTMLVIVTS